jgi:hypothetical protein
MNEAQATTEPLFDVEERVQLFGTHPATGEVKSREWCGKLFGWRYVVLLDDGQKIGAGEMMLALIETPVRSDFRRVLQSCGGWVAVDTGRTLQRGKRASAGVARGQR